MCLAVFDRALMGMGGTRVGGEQGMTPSLHGGLGRAGMQGVHGLDMGRSRVGHGQGMGRAWVGHGQGMGRALAGHVQSMGRRCLEVGGVSKNQKIINK